MIVLMLMDFLMFSFYVLHVEAVYRRDKTPGGWLLTKICSYLLDV